MTTKVENKSRSNDRDFINKSFDKNKEKNKERRKSRKRFKIDSKWQNKSNDYKNKEKVKIFFAKQKNTSESQQNNDLKNYHHSENFEYFNSNHDENQKLYFENVYANIAMTFNVSCRICNENFTFNNAFHKHLRHDCHSKFNIEFKLEKISSERFVYLQNVNRTVSFSIIQSKIDLNQNIDIEYEFKN